MTSINPLSYTYPIPQVNKHINAIKNLLKIDINLIVYHGVHEEGQGQLIRLHPLLLLCEFQG